MSIKRELLYSIGATDEPYNSGDYIFRENGIPQFYYQLVSGDVKLNNYKSDGKEFIQHILTAEDAIGDYMLFTDETYPINAIALTKCSIVKVCKSTLLSFLSTNPKIYVDICKSVSDRLYRKFVFMQKISTHNAAERLKEVLEFIKKEQHNNSQPYTFEVPLTRQQLASLSGLCVETTIRTIKKMEKDKILHIKNRKIMF